MTGNNQQLSRPVTEQYQDELGDWRVRIRMSREKFNEQAKTIFLSKYSEHGRMQDAASAAGVTAKTVREHLKTDTEFGLALVEAEETYRDRLIAHHQDLVFNGTERVTYDRNGNVAGTEKIYPIQLIAMELRKHDEGYRDKKEVNLNVSAGVMVAPAELTMDDWEKQYGKTIEHDPDAPIIIDGVVRDKQDQPI